MAEVDFLEKIKNNFFANIHQILKWILVTLLWILLGSMWGILPVFYGGFFDYIAKLYIAIKHPVESESDSKIKNTLKNATFYKLLTKQLETDTSDQSKDKDNTFSKTGAFISYSIGIILDLIVVLYMYAYIYKPLMQEG